MRLFVRGNLASGSFSEPQSDAAVIEQLGEQQETQALRGTHRYRVIERRYALFPEQSGELNIPGPVFNGEIATQQQQQRRNLFGFGRTPTRAIYAAADPITLEVQAPPQNLAGPDWLPASEVQLQQSLQPDVSRLKAGEPLTRTITLQVRGQLHTQLPALDIANPGGTQAYTEPPKDQTHSDGRGLIATRTYSTAIIAGGGDHLELPAVELSWWDTGNDRLQTARIPAKRIALEAAAIAPPASTPQATPAAITAAAPIQPASGTDKRLWLWQIAAISCAAGWLGTLLAWFWWSRKPRSEAPDNHSGQSRSHLQKLLKQADARQCRQALLEWARQICGKTQTLSSLARQTNNDAQAEALRGLDAAAFGHAEQFDRENLLLFVEQFTYPERPVAQRPLAPLYPE